MDTDLSCDSTTPSTSVLNCSSVTKVVSLSFQIITCQMRTGCAHVEVEVYQMRRRMRERCVSAWCMCVRGGQHAGREGAERGPTWPGAVVPPRSDNGTLFLGSCGLLPSPTTAMYLQAGIAWKSQLRVSGPATALRYNGGALRQGRHAGRLRMCEAHSEDVDSIRTMRDPEVTAGGPAWSTFAVSDLNVENPRL